MGKVGAAEMSVAYDSNSHGAFERGIGKNRYFPFKRHYCKSGSSVVDSCNPKKSENSCAN
jgi:hypothetical protein